jgi:hypothetical protein
MIWIFMESEEDKIKSKQASKKDMTLLFVLICIESTTILKEMRFGQLSSLNERTLNWRCKKKNSQCSPFLFYAKNYCLCFIRFYLTYQHRSGIRSPYSTENCNAGASTRDQRPGCAACSVAMKKAATATTQKHHHRSAIIPKSVAVAKGGLISESFNFGSNLQNQSVKSLFWLIHLKRRYSGEWFGTFFGRFEANGKTFWD